MCGEGREQRTMRVMAEETVTPTAASMARNSVQKLRGLGESCARYARGVSQHAQAVVDVCVSPGAVCAEDDEGESEYEPEYDADRLRRRVSGDVSRGGRDARSARGT